MDLRLLCVHYLAHDGHPGLNFLFLRPKRQFRELNGANPFDYLTELLRHAAELKQHPSEWMPWNYRDTLARLATPAAA